MGAVSTCWAPTSTSWLSTRTVPASRSTSPAAQREDLPEAQVAPERHEDESAQVLGHGFGEGLHLLTVQEGRSGMLDCPAPYPAGVACQRLVPTAVTRMARSVP